MARVVPGGDAREIDLGAGRILRRNKDGAFHVPDRDAKRLAEAVGGFVAGTSIMSDDPQPTGPWCDHGLRPYFCDTCEES